MGGGNLLSFLSQLAYNSGILSKFAMSLKFLLLLFLHHKVSEDSANDNPLTDLVFLGD